MNCRTQWRSTSWTHTLWYGALPCLRVGWLVFPSHSPSASHQSVVPHHKFRRVFCQMETMLGGCPYFQGNGLHALTRFRLPECLLKLHWGVSLFWRLAGPTSNQSHSWLETKPFFQPEIRPDYPLNLSIWLSGGKETNQDSPRSGKWSRQSPALNPLHRL